MTTSIHYTTILDYSSGLRLDAGGYAPLLGAQIEDHAFSGVDLDSGDADYWRDEWWPELLDHNARELEAASTAIDEWRAR